MEKIERNISVKLTTDMLQRLDRAAGELERSRSYVIRTALEDYIKKIEKLPRGIQKLMRGEIKETEPTKEEKEFLSSFEFNKNDFVPDEEFR
jgi:metal-responsive CopG/Arc/MetJ family transcriptional regulator